MRIAQLGAQACDAGIDPFDIGGIGEPGAFLLGFCSRQALLCCLEIAGEGIERRLGDDPL